MRNNGQYSILGRFYDILDYPSELMHYKPLRKKWISRIRHEEILEIGVGTGKNLPYYHHSSYVVGLDREKNMLSHAARKINQNKVNAKVALTLQKRLPWKMPKKKFTQIVATFVFCTMQNPEPVLEELSNWVDKGAKLLLFEYVRPKNIRVQTFVDLINPITIKLFGVDFTRKPTHEFFENNWEIIRKTDVVNDFIVVIEARKI